MSGVEHEELLHRQWQQAFETYRSKQALLVQAWGFLISANTILSAYGVSQRNAGVMLAAAAFPAVMIGALVVNRRDVVPFIYLAVSIEHEMGLAEKGAMTTFVQRSSPRTWRRIEPLLAQPPDDAATMRALRQAISIRVALRGLTVRYLYVIGVAQIAIAIICMTVLDYAAF